MSELFASLPRHLYCYVERKFVSDAGGKWLERCAWFGLTSVTGRAWGLSVVLESGAIYSHLPPNAIVFDDYATKEGSAAPKPWAIEQAQIWDCFGERFALHEYAYLAGRTVHCDVNRRRGELLEGEYLFTAQHYGDGYALEPEQAKQYHFIRLVDVGRLVCLPANRFVVDAAEFTKVNGLPKDLRRQRERFSVE